MYKQRLLLVIALVAVIAIVVLGVSFWRFSATGSAAIPAATSVAATYQNPVFEPDLADPSVIKADDGFFYAYGTENDWQDGKPPHLIPIIRSKNLTQWEYVGNAFSTRPTWKTDGGLWAPDISFHNGTYFLYYSYSIWGDRNPGIGVATATTPAGPFTDRGALFRSTEIGVRNSIDPQAFQDDDGKRYLIWGSFNGIYGIELTADGLKTSGEKFKIAGNTYEAPYIIKRSNTYYLFLSSGSCCEGADSSYFVSIGRAETLQGPYLNPVGGKLLTGAGAPVVWAMSANKSDKHFVGPGHVSVIQDEGGTDWLLYHAIDPNNAMLGDATRRPLMLDRLVWKDGWPTVANLVASTTQQLAPKLR